jgi:hypothetical protein
VFYSNEFCVESKNLGIYNVICVFGKINRQKKRRKSTIGKYGSQTDD